MPTSVRQECRLFSILALVLLFISQYMGIYMTTAYQFPPPLAGALCDRGGRACRVLFPVLAVLAFAAPLMVFTSESVGGAAREGLQDALSFGRQTVFILTLLLTGRLLLDPKADLS
jgi:hypothetical protein